MLSKCLLIRLGRAEMVKLLLEYLRAKYPDAVKEYCAINGYRVDSEDNFTISLYGPGDVK